MFSLIPERANESIQRLSGALEPDGEVVRGDDYSFFTAVAEEDKTIWSQKTQSEAGDSLFSLRKSMLVCADAAQSSYEMFLLFWLQSIS